MKKINLKGISEILSEKELKNVMGGSSFPGCTTDINNQTCRVGAVCHTGIPSIGGGYGHCIVASSYCYCSPYD